MKRSFVSIILEFISLQLSFASGFAAAVYFAEPAGNPVGVFAGAAVFLGSLWVISETIQIFRSREQVPGVSGTEELLRRGPASSPASGIWPVISFLALFLVSYFAGYGTVRVTGNIWFGATAGVLSITGISGMFIWLDRKIQEMNREKASENQQVPPLKETDHHSASGKSSPPFSPGDELVWTEPQSFRKRDVETTRRWLSGMTLLTICLTAVFLVFVNWIGFDREATNTVLVTGCGIAVLFILCRCLTGVMQIVIRITDRAVICDLGENAPVHDLRAIDHCEIGMQLAGSSTYPVLVVELRNGDREIYCIDPAIPVENVRLALEYRGVRTLMATGLLPDEDQET